MAILKSQLNHNDTVGFGIIDEESVNQSFFFEKSFILDSVTVEFDSTNQDPLRDVKLKCEVRAGIGKDSALDLTQSVIDESSWINDEDIPPTGYTFALNGLNLDSGTYWFTIKTNSKSKSNLLLFQKGGSFLINRFIHIRYGTGIYRNDRSLKIIINGTWGTERGNMNTLEINTYTTTTIRDET